MKNRFDLGAIAFALLAMSMAAVSQTSSIPDEKRWAFEDENGVEIESYCVAPLYTKATKELFGERKGDGKLYLIAPVLLKKGDGGFYFKYEESI